MVYNCYMQNTTITEAEAFNQLVAGTMSDDEFVAYAREYLFGEGIVALYEQIGEVQNEMNMFGDSGPGTSLRISESIAEFNKIADSLQAITGEPVRNRPRQPFPCYQPSSYDNDLESARLF